MQVSENYQEKDYHRIPLHPQNKTLAVTTEEKDLGIWVTSNLTWSKHTLDRCAAANRMLGFVRRSATEISDKRIRRGRRSRWSSSTDWNVFNAELQSLF